MTSRVFAFLGFVVLLALIRFLPHPPNFSPMLGLALFAGAKAPQKWLGLLAPVLALWLGDLIIDTHYLMIITGLAMVMASGIGMITEKTIANSSLTKKVLGWTGAGVAASVVFFLITNFFVWQTSGIYPKTSDGLLNCFVMALPFFHNQILSTWLFTGVALGLWAVVEPKFVGLKV